MSPARWIAFIVLLIALIVGLTLAITGAANTPQERQGTPGPRAAFGFPQEQATIIRDLPALRMSAWNDDEHLLVQVVVWGDRDPTDGKSLDGRPQGDNSVLMIDVDASASDTPGDRYYWINLWPDRQGLRYQVGVGDGKLTHIRSDSAGRGVIDYIADLDPNDPTPVRVDNFVIPLAEIERAPGDPIRLGWWGYSPMPQVLFNSTGFDPPSVYYSHQLPRALFSVYPLATGRGVRFDPASVPDGRDTEPPQQPLRPPIEIGGTAPPFEAESWFNAEAPVTLDALAGQLVLVEFWSTNCSTCLSQIPHLNALHDEYGPRGLKIVAFAPQGGQAMEYVVNREQIRYTVGAGSQLRDTYGAPNTPYAFLLRDGRVVWHGNATDSELDRRIEETLGG